MKVLLSSLAAVAFLVACNTAHDNGSSTESAVAAQDPKALTMSRDSRPVDGDLQELKWAKNANATYTVSLHTNFYDRLNGREVDSTTSIGAKMACTFKRNTVSKEIKSISCKEDQRPVDGALSQLTVTKKADGYSASLSTKAYDRIQGKEISSKKDLASGLSIVPALPGGGHQMCTMNAGVLYNPETKACQGFMNGCQQGALKAQGFVDPPEGSTCSM